MKGQGRIGGKLPPEFASPVIDRSRRLRFRLNGRSIPAFWGDTVLSALLANGITEAGWTADGPVALDAVSAPAVVVVGNDARADLAMPMDLAPAMDGVAYATTGPSQRPAASLLSRLGGGRRTSLGLALRPGDPQPGGWIDAPADRTLVTDVAIVGGGVAGLSAALAAVERGQRCCIIEREPVLGGLSLFFGKADGEPNPEDLVASLADRIGQSGSITLLLNTLAFDLDGTTLRAVRVNRANHLPAPEHLSVAADTVVLATGAVGRLPIFPGNRLPNVVDAATAWRLAARYNVWPGKTSHIHTATNVGYRMALLGAASERDIARTTDPRRAPQTRFIEFCKAYGHRLGWGTTIGAVERSSKGQLSLTLVDSETGATGEENVVCDRLVVSGGWQPDLDLWLKAGGDIGWTAGRQSLAPQGDLPNVILAGSVAGYKSLAGCSDHGRAVVDAIHGAAEISVLDPQIDPVFETPDGPLTLSAPRNRSMPAAWISPSRIAQLPRPKAGGVAGLLDRSRRKADPAPGARSLLDIVGLVATDMVPPDGVSRYAQDRAVLPRRLEPATGPAISVGKPQSLPAYLERRFGDEQAHWRLELSTPRHFDAGCLIFINTDERSPLSAVGVVTGEVPGAPTALIGGIELSEGEIVYVRDGLSVVSARLAGRL